MRLRGGPELRARLQSVLSAGAEIQHVWARDAAARIARDAPSRTGALKASIKPGDKRGKAAVLGNWYGIILDRGTRAYTIRPKKAGVLRYSYKGRTIFSKQSNRKRLRRRPFITRGAQGALASSAMTDQILKAWSRRRSTSRFSGLPL